MTHRAIAFITTTPATLHLFRRPSTLPLNRPPTLPTRPPKLHPHLHPIRPTATATRPVPKTDPLQSLHHSLKSQNLSALIVPTSDPHNSEYAPDHYARRKYISSFTGSAGTAVITSTHAYLWTDGRYYLQAEQQLPSSWTLMRAGLPETPEIQDFLAENLSAGDSVGIDPFVHTISSATTLREALEKNGCNLVSLESNPVDAIWGHGRPALPESQVRLHDVRYAGLSVEEKLATLRAQMDEKNARHVVLSMLDEVAWLFNIRAGDIPHCPVVIAYAVVGLEAAALYVDEAKVSPAVRAGLSAAGVDVRPYGEILDELRAIAAQDGEKVWIDPASTSFAISEAVGGAALAETTPVPLAKACKNGIELDGMREAHLRDGVALSMFLCWLGETVRERGEIAETEAADRLEEFRREQDGFLMTSFETIAGSGANGAIIHYSATPGDCNMVSEREVFLLDSGGQYVDGTTDVTRTMHLGQCASEYEKECYTRVLQGHIAIDRAVFPEGTTGLMLDSLARMPLWNIGLDYRHGTGHGVGACLNVHEGPQSISPRIGSNGTGLKEGMIVSNEPGYYEDGQFGIRIENLLIAVKKFTPHEFGEKSYLGFERLTFVPMDKDMMMTSILTSSEIAWVNGYHEEVWKKLSSRMPEGRYKDWLWEKTRPLASSTEAQPATSAAAARV